MKHYIDIENLRNTDIELSEGIVRERNDQAFELGDLIQITEKIDGSNASIRYNSNNKKLDCFSRKRELSFNSTLQGFWNYVQTLNPEDFQNYPNYIIFGEWLVKNKIVYYPENTKKWYIYSIFDTNTEQWLNQDKVKQFASDYNLLYVKELYLGEFKGWDDCKQYLHANTYGNIQEGIVVRNLSKLNTDCHFNHILKIVNDEFKESMVQRKQKNPEQEKSKQEANDRISQIVTPNRVQKILIKEINEGNLPENLTPKDLGHIAKIVPKLVHEDCIKEEQEIVESCGEYGSKAISSQTMKILRKLICR